MASTINKYNKFTTLLAGALNLGSDTLKVALLWRSDVENAGTTYVFSAYHQAFADVASYELSAGSGYTSGGVALVNPSLTESAGVCKFDADDVIFVAMTKTFRSAVVYASGTIGGIVNPVLLYVGLDSVDTTASGENVVIKWNSLGIVGL